MTVTKYRRGIKLIRDLHEINSWSQDKFWLLINKNPIKQKFLKLMKPRSKLNNLKMLKILPTGAEPGFLSTLSASRGKPNPALAQFTSWRSFRSWSATGETRLSGGKIEASHWIKFKYLMKLIWKLIAKNTYCISADLSIIFKTKKCNPKQIVK